MIRTQIQLTEEQAKKLRELSATGRESVAALIRKAVDQFIVSGGMIKGLTGVNISPDGASLC